MHLYQAGVPLPTISEWLGHSNIETTRFYAKVTEEMKREALHKLSDSDSSVFKDDVVFKKGDNTLDWEVVPYARVIDPKIEYKNGKFVATFKCELGDATKANKIVDAKLLCYPDAFVGIYCNYCANDPGAKLTDVVADGKTEYTLTIDPTLPVNGTEFKYEGKYHYFRIAVCAEGQGYNTGRHYNYCQTVKIKL